MLGKGRGSKAPGAGFGTSSRASLVKWDRASLSWKTCEPSLLEESTKFSGRWPTSGTMRSGALYEHPTWAPRIDASASFFWPTVTVDDTNNVTRTSGQMQSLARDTLRWATPRAEDGERGQGSKFDGLSEDVRAWATPTTRDHKDTGDLSGSAFRAGGTPRDDTAPRQAQSWAGTTPSPSEAPTAPSDSSPPKPRRRGLNPRFGLWLMGFPVAWLDSVPSATPSSRRSRKSSGDGC